MRRIAINQVIEKVSLVRRSPKHGKTWPRKCALFKILTRKVFEQHAGYFDLPHVEVADVPVDQIPIYKNWAYIRIFRKNMIKQPDVLNHMFFFSNDFTAEEKKANYEFYEARTIHESSLSPSLHSILALELGMAEQAYQFFTYATRLDLDNYNRNTEQGHHATSAAGVWANLVCGYGGMRSDGAILSFRPQIAHAWNRYQFRINYQGAVIEVAVDTKQATFKLIEGKPVEIKVYDKLYLIEFKRKRRFLNKFVKGYQTKEVTHEKSILDRVLVLGIFSSNTHMRFLLTKIIYYQESLHLCRFNRPCQTRPG